MRHQNRMAERVEKEANDFFFQVIEIYQLIVWLRNSALGYTTERTENKT